MTTQDTEAVQALMATLFSAQRVLRALAPEFKWTYGGNLVGDFGEYMAVNHYGLTKASSGAAGYDATTADGQTVQVKANHAASMIGFRGEADLMLVIHVTDDGEFEEVYFGDFGLVASESRYSERDNKRTISISKLRQIAATSHSLE